MKALEPEVIDAIRTSLDRGETGISIARRLGISKSAVSRIRTGHRHGGRLSRTQRAEIRMFVQQGMQQKAAALQYGVSEATISRICKESFVTIPTGTTNDELA